MRYLLFSALIFAAFPSKADLIKLDVFAKVSSISEYLGNISTETRGNYNFHQNNIVFGMDVSAFFIFDTEALKSSTFASDPTIDIWKSVVDASITLGELIYDQSGWPYGFPMSANIQVWNDRQVTSHPDIVTYSGGVFYTHPLDLGPGEEIAGIDASFFSYNSDVFETTHIPTNLDLENFSYKNLSFIQFTKSDSLEIQRTLHVNSTITSVKFTTLTKVSEPNTLFILISAVLVFMRKKLN